MELILGLLNIGSGLTALDYVALNLSVSLLITAAAVKASL